MEILELLPLLLLIIQCSIFLPLLLIELLVQLLLLVGQLISQLIYLSLFTDAKGADTILRVLLSLLLQALIDDLNFLYDQTWVRHPSQQK